MNRTPEFPPMYLEYLKLARQAGSLSPVWLGGAGGAGGGAGGPPGGWIGQLPQGMVTYDTTEAATTSGSSSLVDNLNHIRYQLANAQFNAGIAGVEFVQTEYGTADIDLGSTADGAYVDVDAVNAAVTITPNSAGTFRATFDFTYLCAFSTTTDAITMDFRLTDGATNIDSQSVIFSSNSPISLSGLFTWSNTTTRTIKLQKKIVAVSSAPASNRILCSSSSVLHMDVFRLGSIATGFVSGSGAAGRVAYWTSGSVLGNDSTFTWDAVNSRLGVGKLSLTSGSMSLAGNVFALDASMKIDTTGAVNGQVLGYNGSKWVPVVSSGSQAATTGSGATGQFALWSATSALFGISSLDYIAGSISKVRVGHTGDSYALGVNSTPADNTTVQITQPDWVGGSSPIALSITPGSLTAQTTSPTIFLVGGASISWTNAFLPSSWAGSTFGVPILSASSVGGSINQASTLKISGSPTSGSNLSIANSYALEVTSGSTYLGGALSLGGKFFGIDASIRIDPSGATNGQVLTFQASSGKWIAAASSASSGGGGVSGIAGSGASTRIAYFTSGSVIAGDSGFVWDTTNQRMVIGGTTSDVPIGSLASLIMIKESGAFGISLLEYGSSSSSVLMSKANGTKVSPSNLLAGDVVGGFNMSGYGATDWASSPRLKIQGIAAENWTDTEQGMYFSVNVTRPGTLTSVDAFDVKYDRVTITGKDLILDASIELDPTSAVSNQVLTYNGSKWIPQTFSGISGISGSGAVGDIAFWTSGSVISGNSTLFWDTSVTPNRMIIGANAGIVTGPQLIMVGETGGAGASIEGYSVSPAVAGFRAGGTRTSPTSTLSADVLLSITGRGYASGSFSGASSGRIQIIAAENFTSGSIGTYISLFTTGSGSSTLAESLRVTKDQFLFGNVSNIPSAVSTRSAIILQPNIDNQRPVFAAVGHGSNASPLFSGLRSRGTAAAPTAVQSGDILFEFDGYGHDGSAWSGIQVLMQGTATENWTSGSYGSNYKFFITPAGSSSLTGPIVTIDSSFMKLGSTSNLPSPMTVNTNNGLIIHPITDGNIPQVALIGHGIGASPTLAGAFSRGTSTAPTAPIYRDTLVQLDAYGYNGTDWVGPRASIRANTDTAWNSGTSGTIWEFWTTPSNSNTMVFVSGIDDTGASFGSARAGLTTDVTVGNDSSTSNSAAMVEVYTSGSGASNPFLSFITSEGVQNYWTFGVDHNDGNKLKLSTSYHAPGTNTILTITTGSAVSWAQSNQTWGGFNIKFDAAIEFDPSGATTNQVLAYNGSKWVATTVAGAGGSGISGSGSNSQVAYFTSGSVIAGSNQFQWTTPSSGGLLTISTTGSAVGDPAILLRNLTSRSWIFGIDSSDGEKFVVSSGSTLGTNDFLKIDSSGNMEIGGHTASPLAYFSIDSTGKWTVRRDTTALSNPGADFSFQGGFHSALNTEVNTALFTASVVTATGNITTFRNYLFSPGSFTGSAATKTITTAATVAISGAPTASSNAVITTPFSLWVQAGLSSFVDGIVLGSLTSGSTGQLWQSSDRQSWNGNVIQFDAAMRFDPTGASTNQALVFSGGKWVPGTPSGMLTNNNASSTPRITLWNNTTSLTGDAAFTWDGFTFNVTPGGSTINNPVKTVLIKPVGNTLVHNLNEAIDVDIDLSRLVGAGTTFTSGSMATQRAVVIRPPIWGLDNGSPGTIFDGATVAITGAPTTSGSALTVTRLHALWVQSGEVAFADGLDLGTATGATTGQLRQSAATQIWNSKTIQFDASMELDPTGASNGQALVYNGSKWIPTSVGGVGGISGSGTANQVAYFTSGSAITSGSNFTFNGNQIGLLTSGSTGGILFGLDTLLYRKSSRLLELAGSMAIDDGLNLGLVTGATTGQLKQSAVTQIWGSSTIQFDSSMRFDQTTATSGSILGYDGTKWVPVMLSSGGGTITGSGVSGQVTYWSGTTAITSGSNFTFNGTQVGLLTSGSTGGILFGLDTLLYRKSSRILELAGGMSLDDGLNLGLVTGAAVGQLKQSSASQIWNTKTIQFDASMELDSTGATSGSVLGYNGTKWVPVMMSSGSGGGGGSTPVDTNFSISNVVGWWKAGAGVTFSAGVQLVSQWDDQIGSNAAVQSTGANKPIYTAHGALGWPAIIFDGGSDSLVSTLSPATGADPRTIAIVVDKVFGESGDAYRILVDYGDSSNQQAFGILCRDGGSSIYSIDEFGGTGPSNIGGAMGACVLFVIYDGSDEILYWNGIEIARKTIGLNTGSGTGLVFGAGVGGSNYAQFILYEVVAWDVAIDSTAMNNAMAQFRAKYGDVL